MIKLTDLLSEGLGPSSSMIKKIEDFLKKELKVSNVKGKKYSQGRARQGYTFYPEGTKNGLYIDQAYDGIWNIYTVGANGFPINNHWEIKKYEDDIEDEATALNAAFDVIKKFGKTLKESVNEEFTAVSNKSGKTVVFKDKDSRDAAVKAGTHSKEDEKDGGDEPKGEKKPNMFSKDAGYDAPDAKSDEPKSEPKSQSMDDLLDKYDGSWARNIMVKDLVKGDLSAEDLVKVAKHHDINLNSDIVQKHLDDPDTAKRYAYQLKVSEKEAISRLEKLRDTLKAQEEPKQDGPVKDSSGGRAGNPQVNKATKKKAEELGITPSELGREEYEKTMVQAAVAALTDSNYHSEARQLIAMIEDKPEWKEDPRKSAPSIDSPEYDEWQKSSVYSSEYYDADSATEELGQTASQEAGWNGVDALDGIAFELKTRGFVELAKKIQSVIKENKSTKLRDLI